jgi:hypothetical protein
MIRRGQGKAQARVRLNSGTSRMGRLYDERIAPGDHEPGLLWTFGGSSSRETRVWPKRYAGVAGAPPSRNPMLLYGESGT